MLLHCSLLFWVVHCFTLILYYSLKCQCQTYVSLCYAVPVCHVVWLFTRLLMLWVLHCLALILSTVSLYYSFKGRTYVSLCCAVPVCYVYSECFTRLLMFWVLQNCFGWLKSFTVVFWCLFWRKYTVLSVSHLYYCSEWCASVMMFKVF